MADNRRSPLAWLWPPPPIAGRLWVAVVGAAVYAAAVWAAHPTESILQPVWATQFAELEWGMSRKKVLSMFASARTYPRHEGHNPRTGEPVIVRESIALPSPRPVPRIPAAPASGGGSRARGPVRSTSRWDARPRIHRCRVHSSRAWCP